MVYLHGGLLLLPFLSLIMFLSLFTLHVVFPKDFQNCCPQATNWKISVTELQKAVTRKLEHHKVTLG